jgi:hypothetical protein
MFNPWMKLFFDTTLMMIEAQQVIVLRIMKFSFGSKGSVRETQRMVGEKMIEAGQAGLIIARGGTSHSVVRTYRGKVRANRRRLAKS